MIRVWLFLEDLTVFLKLDVLILGQSFSDLVPSNATLRISSQYIRAKASLIIVLNAVDPGDSYYHD